MKLKKTIKEIAFWCIPSGIQRLLLSQQRELRRCLNKSIRRELERNRIFYNIHREQRCFILATGPSIQKQDLAPLQNEVCIAVSNFFVHQLFSAIQPKYYCVSGYHKPASESDWLNWIRQIETCIGTATLFLSVGDRERIMRHELFIDKSLHYLLLDLPLQKMLKHRIDVTRSILSPQSVSIMALQLAVYMGFQKIYLLGCDHDWLFHINKSVHFYEEKNHTLVTSGYNEWFGEDFGSYCYDCSTLWEQYKWIRRVASERGIEIFNATEGGVLDVFPLVCYEKLFS